MLLQLFFAVHCNRICSCFRLHAPVRFLTVFRAAAAVKFHSMFICDVSLTFCVSFCMLRRLLCCALACKWYLASGRDRIGSDRRGLAWPHAVSVSPRLIILSLTRLCCVCVYTHRQTHSLALECIRISNNYAASCEK